MGWNSWDSFGTTATEKDIREAAEVMHQELQAFGWQYVTVDEEWYTRNPRPEGAGVDQQRTMDGYGRYTPAVNRFPAAAGGQGFASLAAYVHSLGLKFGIHMLAGIPREALVTNAPIAPSAAADGGQPIPEFHALDAADTRGTCGWNPDNFDVLPNAAGQAYYDSVARLYASWGVDLIKVDCITQPRYRPAELRMLRAAIQKSGRPMLLSLSPGEPPVEFAAELAESAEQWRISNDVWDIWRGETSYPQGVGDQFARTAYWLRTQRPGHWPDADMLSLGYLGPAPGWGKPRQCRLTHAEQRTMMTLWSIFRSPLLFGGNLTRLDGWTRSLLTNREVLAVDQHSAENQPVLTRPDLVVWTAKPDDADRTVGGRYVAVFNLKDAAAEIHVPWTELGFAAGPYAMRDLWTGKDEPQPQSDLSVRLEPHGSALLRVKKR